MKSSEPPRRPNGRPLTGILVVCLILSGVAFRYVPQFLSASAPAYAADVSPSLLTQIAADPDLPVAGNPVGAVTITE